MIGASPGPMARARAHAQWSRQRHSKRCEAFVSIPYCFKWFRMVLNVFQNIVMHFSYAFARCQVDALGVHPPAHVAQPCVAAHPVASCRSPTHSTAVARRHAARGKVRQVQRRRRRRTATRNTRQLATPAAGTPPGALTPWTCFDVHGHTRMAGGVNTRVV